jgi:hypothetical protein
MKNNSWFHFEIQTSIEAEASLLIFEEITSWQVLLKEHSDTMTVVDRSGGDMNELHKII